MSKLLLISSNPNITSINSSLKDHSFDLLTFNSVDKNYKKLPFNQIYVTNEFTDFDTITDLIKANTYDAVFTSEEKYVELCILLQDFFKLNHTSFQHIDCLRNKWVMKQCFRQQSVPHANGFIVENPLTFNSLPFPFILKPAAECTSKFVNKIHTRKELVNAFHTYSSYTDLKDLKEHNYHYKNYTPFKKSILIAETILTGKEYSVDSFVTASDISHTPIFQYVLASDLNIDDHHLAIRVTPPITSKHNVEIILNTITAAIKSIKPINITTHTEVFFDNNSLECKVVEIAGRHGGLRGELIQKATDIDFYKTSIDTALGQKIKHKFQIKRAVGAIYLYSFREGVLKSFDFKEKTNDTIFFFKNVSKVGDKVGLAKNGNKPIAKIAITGTTPEQVLEIATQLIFDLQKYIILSD